jgi:hypothetical protein
MVMICTITVSSKTGTLLGSFAKRNNYILRGVLSPSLLMRRPMISQGLLSPDLMIFTTTSAQMVDDK